MNFNISDHKHIKKNQLKEEKNTLYVSSSVIIINKTLHFKFIH